MKEQTPITALQTILSKTNAPEFTDSRDELCESYLFVADAMEQYANTKVLEILRNPDHLEWLLIKGMELTKSNAKYETFDSLLTFIETEIKPKYE